MRYGRKLKRKFKRQLHRLEPDKSGNRRRYGGSWSIPLFGKGDVVLWRGKLTRVGGFMDGGISLFRVEEQTAHTKC